MKQIGFKNFRRFSELSPISIGRLTLLSGGNNSGKSTIVKAAMLAINYLKTPKNNINTIINMLQYRKFFFDIDNVHVSSFIRGINNHCNPKSESILFSVQLGAFVVDIEVNASDSVYSSYGYVSSLRIEDTERNIKYNYIFKGAPSMTIDFTNNNEEVMDDNTEGLYKEIAELEELTKTSKDFHIISEANDRIISIKRRLRNIEGIKENNIFTIPLSTFADNQNPFFVTHLMASFVGFANTGDSSKEEEKEYKTAKQYIKSREKDIALSVLTFIDEIFSSDYSAQTIRGFFNSGVADSDVDNCIQISENATGNVSVPEKLILKYMNIFGIGSGIRIKSINNESFTVDIIDEFSRIMPLADKGMGSIQLTILLLRVAYLLKKYEFTSHKPIIFVEEPEQNLHPKTQSLLADFFFEISTAYKFQVLVETHSEYLVRKMQVIFASQVKEKEQDEAVLNDMIKVYFFPEDNSPYLMTFLKNGRFENTFGSGFFDEAGKWNRELNKLERQ